MRDQRRGDAQVGAAKKRIAAEKKRKSLLLSLKLTFGVENHKNRKLLQAGCRCGARSPSGCQPVSVRKRARRDAVLAPGVRCERRRRSCNDSRRWVGTSGPGTMPRSAYDPPTANAQASPADAAPAAKEPPALEGARMGTPGLLPEPAVPERSTAPARNSTVGKQRVRACAGRR